MPHLFDLIHIKSREDLPHLGMVALLISGIIIGVYLALQPQIFNKQASFDGIVDIQFAPPVLQVQTNRIYEAKIAINPKGERVTAAHLQIGYDPAALIILEVKNEGFLPVNLKTQDSFDGNLNLIYGSTIESQTEKPGIIASITFKTLANTDTKISINPGSQVSVSSKEGNVLTNFPALMIEDTTGQATTGGEDKRYPDSLLLEKVFYPDSAPFVRDFKEASEPEPELKPERVKPQFSGAYIKQLGRDIFIEPVLALNQVIEEKAGEIINRSEK